MMYQRLITDIPLLILAIILPWWAVLILLLGPLFYFSEPPYFESLLIGFLLDILYGVGSHHLPLSIVFTLINFSMFIATLTFKKRLKFY